jgi:hypothetical protein
MELQFLRFFRKLVGRGWQIGWAASSDATYPKIEYYCPFCKNRANTQAWMATHPHGFMGRAPVARCCPEALPYPVDDNEYLEHLSAKTKYVPDAGRPVTFDRSGADEGYGYQMHDPGF